jgi:branched-subunit amino acid aminotransferase/4-amino-4-deoxychorismate lyase
MQVWINGKFVEREAATVSAFDAGLQHGIGLFETMSAHHGTVFRAEAHCRRLSDSARALLLTESLRPDPLAQAVDQAVERNGLERARVRLTVTGGNLGLPVTAERRRVDPTIIIDVQPPTAYPDAFFEQGVMVVVSDGRLNPMSPDAGHKTLNYWPRIHALQRAAARKGAESLWFTVHNRLAGGSVSNAFVVRQGRVLTPWARGESAEEPGSPAVLPGITRQAIFDLCVPLGIEAERRTLAIEDVLGAEEVFLTNSSWGVLPVVAVERERIGGGEVGNVTARLREAWLALVERETRPA